MQKLLFVTPHLSTGGLPQYLAKQVELLCTEYEIYVVEYNDVTGGVFVVQKNKIKDLIGDKLITLLFPQQLQRILNSIQPDIIHIAEFSESFIAPYLLKVIYSPDRKYKIFETSHGSHYQYKKYLPDAFIFVSPFQINQYKSLNTPMYLVEYPIEQHTRGDRTEGLKLLGLDPAKKHVLNVGLFTPGKNQAEIFEYAKLLPDIEFHFVGNQAINFSEYWKPLMAEKPNNCTVWGERNDVDNFYNCMDLLLFTSQLELNPLVIREGISWNIPILMYNLPVYNNNYDSYKNIKFLSSNKVRNLKLIKGEIISKNTEIVVITAYPDTEQKMGYLNELIDNVTSFGYDIMISTHYPIPDTVKNKVTYNVVDCTDNLLYKEEYEKHGVVNIIYNVTDDRKLIKSTDYTHGYAVWTLWENAVLYLKEIDWYDKIHFIDYDCIVQDKRYLENHSALLDQSSFVFYKSTDYYNTENRVTTNLFSAQANAAYELFTTINSKKDFFVNEYNTSIIEDILHKLLGKYRYKYASLPAADLYRFGTKYNMVNITNLELTNFQFDDFKFNVYSYSDTHDLLYLNNLSDSLLVDSTYYAELPGESIYLIPKMQVHKINYQDKEIIIDMLVHSKYNSIEIYNKNIVKQ
jgi:hypothetical protein